jgi:hypothetical protein
MKYGGINCGNQAYIMIEIPDERSFLARDHISKDKADIWLE